MLILINDHDEDKKFCKKSTCRSILQWYRRHSPLVLCIFGDVSFVYLGKMYNITMFLFRGTDARRKYTIVIFTIIVSVIRK